MPFCVKCGSHMSDDDLFCGSCGAPAKRPVASTPDSKTYTLLISRRSQIMAAVNAYDVYINGELLGRVTNGQSIAARVFSDTVSVEIRSAVPMPTIKPPFIRTSFTRMTLKLKEKNRIDFHINYPDTIVAAVTGADVIEEVH